MALPGVVQADHDTQLPVARRAVHAEVAVSEVDEGDDAGHELDPLLDEHVAADHLAAIQTVRGDGRDRAGPAGVARVGLCQTALGPREARGRSTRERLLETQPIGGQIHQQVAWDDHVLSTDDHRAARPDVVGVVEREPLDLAGNQGGHACGRSVKLGQCWYQCGNQDRQ